MNAVRSAALGALILIQPGAAGCFSCTLLFAPDTVSIVIEGSETLAPGRYQVELTDGPFGGYKNAICVVDLPGGPNAFSSCTHNLNISVNEEGIHSVHTFGLAPDEFVVTIHREGDLLAEEAFDPTYTISQPNGRGCGNRRTASETLQL